MKKIKSLKDEYENANLMRFVAPFETPVQAEGFFLTPFNQKETGLAMWVSLKCIKNKDEPPFLRFQNDRNTRYNSNWMEMFIDGMPDNYEKRI